MSNQLAIATVTGALHFRLNQVVVAALPGSSATNVRPNADKGLPDPGVNIFLYQVTPNIAQRNSDLPTRRSDGSLIKKPVAALDLHYMLSFYGNEAEWQPQVLLGAVVRAMHAKPSIDAETIDDMLTTGGSVYTPLLNTNLNQILDPVRFTPTALTFEEMSKLWGIFYQIPYVLSVAYLASVVLIDADDVARAPRPVLSFQVGAVPLENPFIESADSSTQPRGFPLLPTDDLVLVGRALTGGSSQEVHVDGSLVTATTSTAERWVVKLPAGIPAGVHTVRLIERIQVTPTYASVVESNVRTFAVIPVITSSNATTATAAGHVDVTITVGLAAAIGEKQKLQVSLTRPGGTSFFLPGHLDTGHVVAIATAPGTTSPIPAGNYDLRVFVDGVPSALGAVSLAIP